MLNGLKLRYFLTVIRLQLILLAVIAAAFVAVKLSLVPSPHTLIEYLMQFFAVYGLVAVGVCAFVENIVGVNVYFPGSIVVLAGMGLTAGNPGRAVSTFLVIVVFSIGANFVNFGVARKFLGSREVGEEGPGWIEFFGSLWHPHFASVVSLKSGTSMMSFASFVLRLGVSGIAWYVFWGFTMYHAGDLGKSVGGLAGLFIVYVVLWLIYDLWRMRGSAPR